MAEQEIFKSSIDGRIVSEEFALDNPDTTYKTTVSASDVFDVAKAVRMVNTNLDDLGFTPRDADGNDFQRGSDDALRFKTGTAMGEITTLVMVDNKQVEAIRATSWSGVDRMVLAIRKFVDEFPAKMTMEAEGL